MDITDGQDHMMEISESNYLAHILAYVVENKVIKVLEAESQETLVVEATYFENL